MAFWVKGTPLWRRVIMFKYGATKWVHSTYTHRCMEGCLSKWDGFVNDVQFEVGVGDKVHFWHDRWFGEHPLKEQYPALYSLAAY